MRVLSDDLQQRVSRLETLLMRHFAFFHTSVKLAKRGIEITVIIPAFEKDLQIVGPFKVKRIVNHTAEPLVSHLNALLRPFGTSIVDLNAPLAEAPHQKRKWAVTTLKSLGQRGLSCTQACLYTHRLFAARYQIVLPVAVFALWSREEARFSSLEA